MNGWDFGAIAVVALLLAAVHIAPVFAADQEKRRRHAREMAALMAAQATPVSLTSPRAALTGEGGAR